LISTDISLQMADKSTTNSYWYMWECSCSSC
jgi:hypothetical protein